MLVLNARFCLLMVTLLLSLSVQTSVCAPLETNFGGGLRRMETVGKDLSDSLAHLNLNPEAAGSSMHVEGHHPPASAGLDHSESFGIPISPGSPIPQPQVPIGISAATERTLGLAESGARVTRTRPVKDSKWGILEVEVKDLKKSGGRSSLLGSASDSEGLPRTPPQLVRTGRVSKNAWYDVVDRLNLRRKGRLGSPRTPTPSRAEEYSEDMQEDVQDSASSMERG